MVLRESNCTYTNITILDNIIMLQYISVYIFSFLGGPTSTNRSPFVHFNYWHLVAQSNLWMQLAPPLPSLCVLAPCKTEFQNCVEDNNLIPQEICCSCCKDGKKNMHENVNRIACIHITLVYSFLIEFFLKVWLKLKWFKFCPLIVLL